MLPEDNKVSPRISRSVHVDPNTVIGKIKYTWISSTYFNSVLKILAKYESSKIKPKASY